jgi:hypothetical protein
MTHPMILLPDAIGASLRNNGILSHYAKDRVYHFNAPPGAASPFVEYRHTAGGELTDSPRPALDVTYEITAVSTTEQEARIMADALRDTMIGGGIQVSGWDVFAVFPGNWIMRNLFIEATEYFAMGFFFDIRAAKRD